MSRAWDKEEVWVSDRIWTYDLPNIGGALYQRQMFGRSYTVGSKPVGDPDFFFVLRSWHADYFIFHTNCQRAASRRREAARRQPNRDVRDCSRGKKNLESM